MADVIVYLVMKDTSDFDPSEEVQYVASTKEKAEEFIARQPRKPVQWSQVYSVVEWAVDK